MNAARRCTMEDAWVVDRNLGSSNTTSSPLYLAVYDGHGGREMVDFLEAGGLSYHVAQEWLLDDTSVSKKERLERAFLLADLHARHLGVSTSGATVALCLVERVVFAEGDDDKKKQHYKYHVTTANVGDARIVLGQHSRRSSTPSGGDGTNNATTTTHQAVRLTTDHRVDDPLEVARIVDESGGFFFKNRVCGVLAVTRSLGDQILKPFVIAHPTVRETVVETSAGNGRPSFLIVACDGLWDVLSDEEAVRFVNSYCDDDEACGNRGGVAQALVQEALRRGSSDNVTAVVAWLV